MSKRFGFGLLVALAVLLVGIAEASRRASEPGAKPRAAAAAARLSVAAPSASRAKLRTAETPRRVARAVERASTRGARSTPRRLARPAAARRAVRRTAAAVVFDLCVKTGTKAMADSTSVPIWGFALKGLDCASATAALPGPVLEVNVGDEVTVNLTNPPEPLGGPGENVSILFPGQSLLPDYEGAAPGTTKSYSFTASNPGTYLYEAGVNAQWQVPRGLYGALVVRPATPFQAYGSAVSAYDEEEILVLSEFDADLDDPGFSLLDYQPDYWLINGKSYPQTLNLTASAGQRLLVRYLNAGSINHTMTLLGLHQRVIAKDSDPEAHPHDLVAETIPSGQTADMIVTTPAGASVGDKFPLYNRQLHVTNVAAYPGGQLTYVEIVPEIIP